MSQNNDLYKGLIREERLTIKDVLAAFKLGGVEVSRSKANAFSVSPDNRRFQKISDNDLAAFRVGVLQMKILGDVGKDHGEP